MDVYNALVASGASKGDIMKHAIVAAQQTKEATVKLTAMRLQQRQLMSRLSALHTDISRLSNERCDLTAVCHKATGKANELEAVDKVREQNDAIQAAFSTFMGVFEANKL